MLAVKPSLLIILMCLGYVTAKVDVVVYSNLTCVDKHQTWDQDIYHSTVTTVFCDTNFESIYKCNVSQTQINNIMKPVTCKIEIDNDDFLDQFSIFTLSAKKAIVMSKSPENDEKQYIKYSIINFPDCKTSEAKIYYKSHDYAKYAFREHDRTIVINEDETFDILHNDTEVCGDKICKLTVDAQGNIVRGPSPFYVPLYYSMKQLKKGSVSGSFIVTEGNDVEFVGKFSLITADGQQVILRNSFVWMYDVSTFGGVIRHCTSGKRHRELDCDTFDSTGKIISKISINVTQEIVSSRVHNLANGEFLLLIHGSVTDSVMKVSSDMSILGNVELYHFPLSESYANIDVDTDGHNYCVTRIGYEDGCFKIRKECFDDSDFH